MSAPGQLHASPAEDGTSASPLNADIELAASMSAKGQQATSCPFTRCCNSCSVAVELLAELSTSVKRKAATVPAAGESSANQRFGAPSARPRFGLAHALLAARVGPRRGA